MLTPVDTEIADASSAPAADYPMTATLVLNSPPADREHLRALLPNKFIAHHPKAGVNPLVDAAAYLLSVAGKLKQLKTYRQFAKLQQELITEVNAFQEVAKSHGYSSEYILVSRYALCATLDDVIIDTAWGGQGQWDPYRLLLTFQQESAAAERFFLILERIIKDPALYIDIMELMYLCLSLGYKGTYRTTEYSHTQLEKITHNLYKRIRAYRGEVSKNLSPAPHRPRPTVKPKTHTLLPYGITLLTTASIIMAIFIGLGLLLDTISNQAYRELIHIGKSLLYETPES